MLRNYLKMAWRNLGRNKVYSAINISGLSIGLAVCMLLVLYVGHETNYDKFHKNAERIGWIQTKVKIGNDSLYMPYVRFSTGPTIKQIDPSVEGFLRYKLQDKNTIIQNPLSPSLKFAEESFLFADSNFFSFFSFRLLQGHKNNVLQKPFSVVISEDVAVKYFGNENPVGKIIRYNNTHDFTITGVAKKKPSNSSIKFDFVASLSSMSSISGERDLLTKDEGLFSTYFLLKTSKDFASVERSLTQIETTGNAQVDRRFIVHPLNNIHLYADIDNANTKYLKIFSFVSVLVLLLAIINYVSLSTARSTTRSKEVGVRKVLGADRKIIAHQFFIESALYTAIAFVLGYLLCILFQPVFFNFLRIEVDYSFFYSGYTLMAFATLFIVTVVLAATYPAILLSAYKPILVLYGRFRKQPGGIGVRKFFTVFQFAISVVLIICGIVISRQIYFIKHTDTGVKKENVLMLSFSPNVGKHYAPLKKEILSLPAVQQVSVALHPLYKGYDMMGTIPKNSNQMILMPTFAVDQNYISLLGLKWKYPPVDSVSFLNQKTVAILNETAVEKLSLTGNPVGQKIDDQFTIAGVLQDFNYASLQNKIDGLCLFVTNDSDTSSLWTQRGGSVFIKLSSQARISSLMQDLKSIFERYDPQKPFDYYFLDEAFEAQYKAEDRLSKILTAFTLFTVLLASLGLFGLATFTAIQRTKEIGIRKILGASVENVVALLSTEFLKLVMLAVIIASPIAWWFMNDWLEAFAYRITIKGWMFLAAGGSVILIALITISFQSIKAAIANPVTSLRAE